MLARWGLWNTVEIRPPPFCEALQQPSEMYSAWGPACTWEISAGPLWCEHPCGTRQKCARMQERLSSISSSAVLGSWTHCTSVNSLENASIITKRLGLRADTIGPRQYSQSWQTWAGPLIDWHGPSCQLHTDVSRLASELTSPLGLYHFLSCKQTFRSQEAALKCLKVDQPRAIHFLPRLA